MAEYYIGNGGKPKKLSPSQIYAVAREAGFNPADAVMATSIALAESGGVANVVNDNPGTGDLSYGLMQVNMLGQMGPQRLKDFGLSNNEQLADPLVNMRAAKHIYDGEPSSKKWWDWTTFKDGAWRNNYSTATAAATDELAGGSNWLDKQIQSIGTTLGLTQAGQAIDAGISWTEQLSGLLSKLSDARFWVRIGQGAASIALLLIGMGMVFRKDATAYLSKAALV